MTHCLHNLATTRGVEIPLLSAPDQASWARCVVFEARTLPTPAFTDSRAGCIPSPA